MMSLVFYIIAVLSAFVLQGNGFLFFIGSGLRADFALLVVVYVSLFWGGERALLVGFFTGLLQDALSSEMLGLSALGKCAAAFTVYWLCRNVHIGSLIAQWLFTGLALIVDNTVRLLVMGILQSYTFALAIVFGILIQQTLLSLLLMPCVFYMLHAMARGLRVPHEKGQGNVAAQSSSRAR